MGRTVEISTHLTLQALKRAFVQGRARNETDAMRSFRITIGRMVDERHMLNGDSRGSSRLARASYPKNDIFGSLENWRVQNGDGEPASENRPEGGWERLESVSPGWQEPKIASVATLKMFMEER